MRNKLNIAVLMLCLLAVFPVPSFAKATEVGVIRFDAWYSSADNPSKDYQKFGPRQWNYRLPFFTTFDANGQPVFAGDRQAIIDQEIAFANAAGIAYFAFDYYPNEDLKWQQGVRPTVSYGLRHYLSSTQKNGLKFSLIIVNDDHFGDPATWKTSQAPAITALTKDPNYQTVTGGRPLVYFLGADFSNHFGSPEKSKDALNTLRAQIQAATGQNPFFVALDNTPIDIKALGYDGRSVYLGINVDSKGGPYSQIAASNLDIWNILYQMENQVIPLVSAGYDQRPRWQPNEYQQYVWFQPGTPTEIAANLQAAINWQNAHPDKTDANSILLYAWNEYIEGGWLSPTLLEGDARLQAVSRVLRGSPFTSPRFKARDITGDGQVDLFDYNRLVAEFGTSVDAQQRNGDMNGDGVVDMFDYNILVANFGK